MACFSCVLISLLFGLTPFVVGALLVPVLCRKAVVRLPRSFLIPHVVMSLLARLFLDLTSSLWLFLPVFGITVFLLLTAGPAIASVYTGSVFLVFLSKVFSNVILAGSLMKDNFHELNPFDVKENVRESVREVGKSLGKFFDSTDFTEVFHSVKAPSGDSWDTFFKGFGDIMFKRYNFSEAVRNLTISESTQQYIDTVNVAVIGLLGNADVSNFFNTTRIPPDLHVSLDKVSEGFRNLAEHLNFTVMLKEVAIPGDLQDSIDNLGEAMGTFGENLNLTELFEAMSSPATEEAFKQFRDPATAFQSFGKSAGTTPLEETFRAFTAWVPIRFHYAASLCILLLVVGIPCVFILRAALQEGCLWVITKRYGSDIPSVQRSASGWLFVGVISGIASGAAEAAPHCCLYFYLYTSNVLSSVSLVLLVGHTLTTIPLRAAAQMRIAETAARKDVLKDNRPGFVSGFVLAAVIEGVFNMWWLCFSGTLIISRVILWLPGLFVLADAVLVGFSVFWGRRIYHRVLRDERQMIEERERKRD